MAGIDIFKDVAGSIVKGASGLGRKIISNASIDGGIEGLSKKSFELAEKNLRASGDVISKGMGMYSKAGKEIPESMNVISEKILQAKKDNVMSRARIELGGASATGELKKHYMKSGLSGTKASAAVAMSNVGAYYAGGNKAQTLTRAGLTAGAYVGVNAAGRYVTGGTYDTNGKGERDIAGIPFL